MQLGKGNSMGLYPTCHLAKSQRYWRHCKLHREDCLQAFLWTGAPHLSASHPLRVIAYCYPDCLWLLAAISRKHFTCSSLTSSCLRRPRCKCKTLGHLNPLREIRYETRNLVNSLKNTNIFCVFGFLEVGFKWNTC